MDFSQKIRDLANRSKHATAYAMTEEATKTSVVMPFLQTLGFDVFNLEEVVPEFIADVGIKKGEKIDFAVRLDGKVAILLEAKPINMPLGAAQYSQLYRYFAVAGARLAILTNGREIWFFSDIQERNKLDAKPFFTFDLQNYDEAQVDELARFHKSNFDIERILEAASKLNRTEEAASYLKKQLTSPDDEFVKHIGRQIYDGSLTKAVIEELRPAIQAALDKIVRDRIQERLGVTFSSETSQPQSVDTKDQSISEPEVSDTETTEEEKLAFLIVRAIASKIVAVDRVTIRDAKSYCAVLMDDNNRKTICRLHFNGKSAKFIGLFDSEKNETRHQISEPAEIYKFSEQILQSISNFAPKA